MSPAFFRATILIAGEAGAPPGRRRALIALADISSIAELDEGCSVKMASGDRFVIPDWPFDFMADTLAPTGRNPPPRPAERPFQPR